MSTRVTADRRRRSPMITSRSVIAAMYAGLALTLVATIVPYVDRATVNTLADHIRAGIPYTEGRIDTAATTYLVYLSVIGALGMAGRLWTIRAVQTGRRWARGVATAMFGIGTAVALTAADQGHLRGHRPVSFAGLGRDPAVPGGAGGGHPAVAAAVTRFRSGVHP